MTANNSFLLLWSILGSLAVQETTAFVAPHLPQQKQSRISSLLPLTTTTTPFSSSRRQRVYDTSLSVIASEDLVRRINEPNGDDSDSDGVSTNNKNSKNSKNNNKTKKCPDRRLKLAFETETPQTVGMTFSGILNSEPMSMTTLSSLSATTTTTTASATTIEKKEDKRKVKYFKNGKKPNKKRLIKNKDHRRHDFQQRQSFLRERPDLDFYTLHSSSVSHLYKGMPIDDITRAIKRAQNLHDVHDLATIATFLIHEWHDSNQRGSLLSRLAVAALHCNEIDIAQQAIRTRRTYERPSMEPYQSSAIVRGLMRVGLTEEAYEVLDDELGLPPTVASSSSLAVDLRDHDDHYDEILKHRAHTLASMASRHFYSGQPREAAKALEKIREMGSAMTAVTSSSSPSLVNDPYLTMSEWCLPWGRLVTAASACNKLLSERDEEKNNSNNSNDDDDDDTLSLPENLEELVWNAMWQVSGMPSQ